MGKATFQINYETILCHQKEKMTRENILKFANKASENMVLKLRQKQRCCQPALHTVLCTNEEVSLR